MAQNIQTKITLIGDASVGKTSILKRYHSDEFVQDYRPTLGADFVTKTIQSPNENPELELYLWDLAGQPEFNRMKSYFLTGSYFSLIIADISEETTWDLEPWISVHEAAAAKPENKVIVLNKIDLEPERAEEIKREFEEKYDLQVFMTSAKTGKNVNGLFDEICRKIWDKFSEQ